MVALVITKTGNDKTMTLDDEQWRMIASALHAVSPSGGGSGTFHLANFIEHSTGVASSDRLVGMMQRTAYEEFREHSQEEYAEREVDIVIILGGGMR